MKTKQLLITLLMCCVSISISAAEWTDANGTVWNFSTSGTNATITSGISGTIPNDLVIPSTVYVGENAYTVTSIRSQAFSGCSSLTSINFPDGVTSIGSIAFSGCTSLTSINIPDGVTSIENGTFTECTSLTSIIIPDDVTSIGESAFARCWCLTSINTPDGVTSIRQNLFNGCSSLTSIILPDDVTSIGNRAFYGCSSLTSIDIPESVTSIGSNAFAYCSSIGFFPFESPTPTNNIDYMPDQTTTIIVPDAAVNAYKTAWPDYQHKIVGAGDNVWKAYTLTAQEGFPDLVNKVGEENMLKVTKLRLSGTMNGYDMMAIRNKMVNLLELDLENVNIVGSNYEYYTGCHSEENVLGANFLRETGIISVRLPNSITRIGESAFNGCHKLCNVTNFTTNLTAIDDDAFSNCYVLKNVNLPSSLTTLGAGVFNSCYSLSSVVMPKSVTVIPNGTFAWCRNLSSVHLSKKTTEIGYDAFYGCTKLVEFRLPPSLQSIGDDAFRMVPLKKVYAYMPNIPDLNTNSFSTYQTATLYAPPCLYNDYYVHTNWSQFLSVEKCALEPGDYESLDTDSETSIESNEEIIPNLPNGDPIDGEVGEHGSMTIGSTDPQAFDEMTQNLDGEGLGGSLIANGGDGDTNNNMPVNQLKVKIQVKANRWYFFCFPFDVTIASCEYPGQYAWRTYNSAARAGGNAGWENVTGSTLTARQGYIFQSATAGTLVVNFNHPTFGGNRTKTLDSYTVVNGNAADASWNFVGNPYSCFYEFDENDFSSPITVWNGTGYEAYRPGDDDYHLQPYEAFFVQKPSDVDEIAFGKERRETYRQSQEKKTHQAKMRKAQGVRPERLLINLNIGDQETENIDRTRLVLNENASRKYELECDAAKFISDQADAQLYMVENGVQMAINERPTKGDIRMGYKAKKAGTLRIEASRMDLPMMLVDTKTNQTFDLSLGSYEFETEAGTFNSRFMLRPSDEATAIKELTAKTGVAIGTQDGGLSIGGAEGKIISIYTTNGAQVAQQAGNGFVSLSSGLYIVKVANLSAKIYVK